MIEVMFIDVAAQAKVTPSLWVIAYRSTPIQFIYWMAFYGSTIPSGAFNSVA